MPSRIRLLPVQGVLQKLLMLGGKYSLLPSWPAPGFSLLAVAATAKTSVYPAMISEVALIADRDPASLAALNAGTRILYLTVSTVRLLKAYPQLADPYEPGN